MGQDEWNINGVRTVARSSSSMMHSGGYVFLTCSHVRPSGIDKID